MSDGRAARCRRNASRSRRLARFRLTAPRTCRLTVNPAFRVPGVGIHRATNAGRSTPLPRSNTAWNSPARRSRASRGSANGFAPLAVTAELDREPLPPLRPPPLQNFAAARRLHALAEAVRLGPAPPVRLIRPLHREFLSIE